MDLARRRRPGAARRPRRDRSCPSGVVGRRPAAGRDRARPRRHPRAVGRAGQGEVGPRPACSSCCRARRRFEPVVQHRAPGGGRGDGPRRPASRRRPTATVVTGATATAGTGGDRGPAATIAAATGATADEARRGRARGDGDDRRRQRPHFTPPPEVPQRPKPKRLRPGKQHRTDVLAATPEEQRPVAELALQGMAAVRQRLREDNVRLKAEGKPEMPEAAVMRMAEDAPPDAARRRLARPGRGRPAPARAPRPARPAQRRRRRPTTRWWPATRRPASWPPSLKAALVTKQEEELTLWLGDVEAALDVGRVVRALRLSSQPPKAGVPFPGALATRLAEATTASLQPTDGPDRWSAVLEAVAFSPVRTLVAPTAAPEATFGRAAGDGQAARSAAPAGRRPVRHRGARRTPRRRSRCARRRAATPRRSRPPSRPAAAPAATRRRAETRRPRRRPPPPRTRRSPRRAVAAEAHRRGDAGRRPRTHRRGDAAGGRGRAADEASPPPRTPRPRTRARRGRARRRGRRRRRGGRHGRRAEQPPSA